METETKTIEWKPRSLNQIRFHQSPAFEKFYGGAAGGGKTDALMREALRQIDNPNYRCILFRRTFPEVETSFIEMAYKWYKPQGLIPKDGGKVWIKPGGGKIRFAHLQYERDVHKHQSAEYTVIGFDELTSFTEFQYDYLRSRCRTSDPTLRKYIMSASNPGNVGHGFVKRRFIDVAPPNTLYRDPQTGLTRMFIPARVYDNPVLMENDPEYVKRLESLPEQERRALLEGDWDVFAGQFFREWRRDIHVIEPFKLNELWKRFICMDYGYAEPAAVYWGAIDFWGRVIFYREIYATGYTYEELGKYIADMNGDDKISWFVVDKHLMKKSNESGIVGIELLKKGLALNKNLKNIRFVQANDERIEGWTIMRDFMKVVPALDGGMTAGVVWFSTCTEAIRTIPELVHDDIRPEDVDTDGEDHAGDACRYGLVSVKMKPARRMSADDIRQQHEKSIERLNREWRMKKLKKLRKMKQRRII